MDRGGPYHSRLQDLRQHSGSSSAGEDVAHQRGLWITPLTVTNNRDLPALLEDHELNLAQVPDPMLAKQPIQVAVRQPTPPELAVD